MYVCMCICMYTSKYVYAYVRIYQSINVYMNVYVYSMHEYIQTTIIYSNNNLHILKYINTYIH